MAQVLPKSPCHANGIDSGVDPETMVLDGKRSRHYPRRKTLEFPVTYAAVIALTNLTKKLAATILKEKCGIGRRQTSPPSGNQHHEA
jgi:hypothetical protein